MVPPPPGTISFGGGVPDPATLPIEQLNAATQTVLSEQGVASLQYGGAFGDMPLREEIARLVTDWHGVETSPDHVVVTTGSSQALDIVCTILIDPGDVVVLENPTFTGSLWTFRAHGARLVTVPVDADGMDTDALEQTLRELRAAGVTPKIIYVTPDYQNPTGTQMPEERRQRLVRLAAEAGSVVVEDTAYEAVGIDGFSAPSLLSLAPERVVQMSTFSKMIGPGLRIGWLTGWPAVVNQSGMSRTDMGTSVILSRILAQFLKDGALAPHLERVRGVYREKRDAFDRAARENLGPLVSWSPPGGGFFYWLAAREGVDVPRLWEIARENRVGFAPGFRFYAEEGAQSQAMRFAFSEVSVNDIHDGLSRLGRAFEQLEQDDGRTWVAVGRAGE